MPDRRLNLSGHDRLTAGDARVKWVVYVAVLVCVGCQPTSSDRPADASDTVAMPPPARIVSMAPNLTEILFALGLDDRIVGVSSFCDYPPESATKSRIGGVLNPDIEAILALQPDLVVNIPGNASEKTISQLNELGVRTLVVGTDTVEQLFAAIKKLGTATHREKQSTEMIASMKSRLDEIRAHVSASPHRKTLFVIGHSPLYVAGPNTFIDDLIEIAGGINIAHDAIGQYPRFGIEEVIERRPEVIIDSTLGSAFPEKDVAARRKWWSQWDTIPAVRDGHIYGLDTDTLLRPGPRMPQAALMIAKSIHPELFDEEPK